METEKRIFELSFDELVMLKLGLLELRKSDSELIEAIVENGAFFI